MWVKNAVEKGCDQDEGLNPYSESSLKKYFPLCQLAIIDAAKFDSDVKVMKTLAEGLTKAQNIISNMPDTEFNAAVKRAEEYWFKQSHTKHFKRYAAPEPRSWS